MIRRELAIFLIVGSLTVLIDFLIYRSLVWTGLVSVNVAKAVGFLTGTVFAYFANRFWTFAHKAHAAGSMWRFIFLYAITLGANVLINSIALALLPNMAVTIQVPFLLATGVSASLNFIGMKLFVFRATPASEMP
jgi:putative flippase GtrA